MRILYSHYLPTDDHAATKMVHQIASQLRLLGHEVLVHRCVETRPTEASSSSKGWTSYLRSRLGFAKAMARNLRMERRDQKVIEHVRPDVVLARQDAYFWSMARASVRLNVPLVTYADAPVAHETRLFHSRDRWHPPGLVEVIERWGLRHSRAVITVSQPAARQLRRYKVDVPIHVVPNGIDPNAYSSTPSASAKLREELGFGEECVIGFQGSFRPFHGLELLRRLMLALADRPGIRWLLLGDGPGRANLEQAVAGRVRALFLGQQPQERVGRLLQVMDIAVVPHAQVCGEFYFCPLKILECAGAGAAVVAGNQGDIPWLLDEGRAGVVVSTHDAAAWTEAITSLLDDPIRRCRLAQSGIERMRTRFTWHQTALRVEKVLQRVVTKPSAGAA